MASNYEFSAGRFTITSHGNGWAYTVTDTHDGRSFFVQDDDASTLRNDTDEFTNEDVILDYMDCLGEEPNNEQVRECTEALGREGRRMPEVRTTTVYTFEELSEEAQGRAVQHYADNYEFNADDMETVIDDAVSVGRLLGITIKERQWTSTNGHKGSSPQVYYDLDRGSVASFDGEYSYQKGAPKAIRGYAPLDKELHAIADLLQSLQRRNFYKLRAMMYASSISTDIHVDAYAPSVCMNSTEAGEALRELIRDFAGWVHSKLRKEYEYMTSEEAIRERIIANEYRYTEDGKMIA